MGRLSSISRAVRAIDENASKAGVSERQWMNALKGKKSLQGMDEYFARNAGKTESVRGKYKPKMEMKSDDDVSLTGLRRSLGLKKGGRPVRKAKGGVLNTIQKAGQIYKVAAPIAKGLGITGGALGSGLTAATSAVGSGLSSAYGALASMGPAGWAAGAALAAGAVAAKNAPKSSPLDKFNLSTGGWDKGENFAKQQYDPALLNAYYGPAIKAFQETGDARAALAALPAPTNAQEQALFDGRDHLFSGTGNPFRQIAKSQGLKDGAWKAGSKDKKALMAELKASAAAPGTQVVQPQRVANVPDLAALRQQAMTTNAAAPTQLSMMQANQAQTPRVQPQMAAPGSPSLLQKIQQQQASRSAPLLNGA